MDDLTDLEARILDLNQKSKEARPMPISVRAGSIRMMSNKLMQERENYIRDVYYAAARLFILQRIYFMSGDTGQALHIATIGDKITDNRVGFPKTKEENEKMVNQIFPD